MNEVLIRKTRAVVIVVERAEKMIVSDYWRKYGSVDNVPRAWCACARSIIATCGAFASYAIVEKSIRDALIYKQDGAHSKQS